MQTVVYTTFVVQPHATYNPHMGTDPKPRPKGPWTPEEIARNERAVRERARRDQQKTREERLEETLRMSRFLSELRQGMLHHVRTR